jgi:hypothetical protein
MGLCIATNPQTYLVFYEEDTVYGGFYETKMGMSKACFDLHIRGEARPMLVGDLHQMDECAQCPGDKLMEYTALWNSDTKQLECNHAVMGRVDSRTATNWMPYFSCVSADNACNSMTFNVYPRVGTRFPPVTDGQTALGLQYQIIMSVGESNSELVWVHQCSFEGVESIQTMVVATQPFGSKSARPPKKQVIGTAAATFRVPPRDTHCGCSAAVAPLLQHISVGRIVSAVVAGTTSFVVVVPLGAGERYVNYNFSAIRDGNGTKRSIHQHTRAFHRRGPMNVYYHNQALQASVAIDDLSRQPSGWFNDGSYQVARCLLVDFARV